jgi:aminoglycoside 2'-N-acetyltransferase I
VIQVRTVHTADLDPDVRTALRGLLDASFREFGDDAFDNVLGGLHVMVFDDGVLIGHASVIQRRMLHRGMALRAGYVEGVAVREDRRRHGHGAALMAEAERIVRSGYDLGALGASEDGSRLYRSRGWQLWRGPASVLTPDGLRRTPGQDGYIYVLPVAVPLDLAGEITCDWRHGSVW